MAEFESFIREKLNPVYRAHYALWVYWWPLWRDNFSGRNILRKWHESDLVRKGQTILDYGCGTGSFTIPAARIVGDGGTVYALDCFPRQLEIVAEKSRKAGLANVETILAEDSTGLPGESIDVVWMCDVLHEIKERQFVIEELHRVLKKGGVLAIYDGMKGKVLDYTDGLFTLACEDGKFYKFLK
ncbi:MAG: class I SAM-dependent methyltransferase [Chloroflexi bacterium]|nr:class I SAM-dependent methyltransferase [Chloroflexota bacterium]